MIKLKKIPLSKLRNVEIVILLDNVLEVLEKHNLETLHLQSMHDVLLMQKPVVKILAAPLGEHPLTAELARLHKKRLMYASLINAQVKAMLNIDDEKMQYMAVVARRETQKHLTYFGQHGRSYADYNLNMFLLKVKSEEDNYIRDAFVSLGLEPQIAELRKTQTRYLELDETRRDDLKNNSRKNFSIVRRDALWVLRLFFDKIITNQKSYKDVDYSQLINELNVYLTANSKRIKTRIATNKRRARKKEEAKQETIEKKVDSNDNLLAKSAPEAKKETKSTTTISQNTSNVKPSSASRQKKSKEQPIDKKDLMKALKKKGKGRGGS